MQPEIIRKQERFYKQQLLAQTQKWVRAELARCAEFWLAHGLDARSGGIFTCLDRTGRVYSTDKNVGLQARCAWAFCALSQSGGARQPERDAAGSCLAFLERHCTDGASGRLYALVTDEGALLRRQNGCFYEGFYAMANAAYYGVTREEVFLARARSAFERICRVPVQFLQAPAAQPPARRGRTLADAVLLLELAAVLRAADPARAADYDACAAQCAAQVFRCHVKPELKCTLENTGLHGEFWQQTSEGRVVCPGRGFACSWLLMDYATRLGGESGQKLHQGAELILRGALEGGWDKGCGGVLHRLDALGSPPQSYDHDMKLWWPHCECLSATLTAYRDTGEEFYFNWFCKTLEYCKTYFSDPEYGEWYEALRRDGKPTMPPAKGSLRKGPFHLLRTLLRLDEMLGALLRQNEAHGAG